MSFSQRICSTRCVRAVKIVLALFLLSILLPACMKPTPTPMPQRVTTVENAGEICFREYSASAKKLTGVFLPKGCYSSSCTRQLEQTVEAVLDKDPRLIKLTTKFVLLDTTVRSPEAQQCTADCEGGGEVSFGINDVADGIYSIQLGDENLGNLTIPLTVTKAAGICFGDR